MDNEKISVIIPVYNVEPYLGKCLDSVTGQTYANLEIILIDDGSTDSSGDICDEYAARDGRITVIHQRNRGLSGARNAGIDAATGSYLSFVDSDDEIDGIFIETLYNACREEDAELAMCMFRSKSGGDINIEPEKTVCSAREMSLRLNRDGTGNYGVVWNKLYSSKLFEKIRFPEGRLHEDEYVTYLLLWSAGSSVVINKALYHYRTREGSIVNSRFTERSLDAAYAYQQRTAFYEGKHEDELSALSQAAYCHFLRRNFGNIKRLAADTGYWRNQMLSAFGGVMRSGDVGLKKKLALSLHMLSPGLYGKLKKRMNNR